MKYTFSAKKIFEIWIFQGIVAFFWIFLIPTDGDNKVFLGFTSARLLLLGTALVLTLFSVILFFNERLFKQAWLRDAQFIGMLQDVLFIIALFVCIFAPASIFVLRSLSEGPQYKAYAERLMPLSAWFTLAGMEFIFYIMCMRYEQGTELIRRLDTVFWQRVVVVFGVLLPLIGIVAITGIGITPDYNMGSPAIPLWEWQVLLICLVLTWSAFFPKKVLEGWDRWAVLIVYLFTVVIWMNQPINPAYTATPPRAPNFEIYPFSDPQIYSQYAESALVGNGFLYPDVPSRAFYVAFLTWANWFGKQDYELIVVWQTLALAWFPVSLYLIGRELGGRVVGLGLAAMPIFRDINSNIAVPFASNVTYSKLLLSELPLALFLGLCVLCIIRWIKYNQNSISLPILAGGLLGVASLIRTQSVVLIAVIAIITLLMMHNKKQWLIGIFIFSVALAFTVFPWLVRNYVATGGLVLDNPTSQVMTMARRWNGSWGNETLPHLPDETDAQYSSRMTEVALEAFRRDPQYILHTAANHFVNSEIASLMVLPLRSEFNSFSEFVTPQSAFWSTTLKPQNLLLFALYLSLFGVGMAAAIRRLSWLGLFPLSLGVSYNLWTALFFSSGERFIVPLDWTIYFYQVIGFVTFGALLLGYTKNGYENASAWIKELIQPRLVLPTSEVDSRQRIWLAIGIVVLLAVFTPFTEFIFPQRYTAEFMSELEKQSNIRPSAGETVLYGRVIYPRYYFSGEGEPDSAKLGYEKSKEPRLVFYVVGSSNALVVFYLKEVPTFFPNASDVYLVGMWSDKGYFSPRAAFVRKDGQTAEYQLP